PRTRISLDGWRDRHPRASGDRVVPPAAGRYAGKCLLLPRHRTGWELADHHRCQRVAYPADGLRPSARRDRIRAGAGMHAAERYGPVLATFIADHTGAAARNAPRAAVPASSRMRVGPLMSERSGPRPRHRLRSASGRRCAGHSAPAGGVQRPAVSRSGEKNPPEYCICWPEWFSQHSLEADADGANAAVYGLSQWAFWTAPNTIFPRIPDARV